MRKLGLVMVAGLGLGLLSACGSSDPADNDSDGLPLDGRSFVGSTVTVDGDPYPLASGSVLRLSFDRSTIGATGGCNTMGGDASWDTGVLKLNGQLATTEMACEPALMDQDAWFANILGSEPTLDETAETLTLTSDATVIELTDEEVAVPDRSLTGTEWRLDAIVTGSAVSSVPAGTQASVTFADDGSLGAFLGCNQATGAYTLDGNQLTIEPLASTKRACNSPASEVENAMLQTLKGVVDYTIDGDVLELTPATPSGDAPSELIFRAGGNGPTD